MASLGHLRQELPWRQENASAVYNSQVQHTVGPTFLSLGPRGPYHPSRDSVKEVPSPLSPARICHQGLISIRPECPFAQANGRGAVPQVEPQTHPTAMASPGHLRFQAHNVSGFVLGKQNDKTALSSRNKQDKTPLPSLPAQGLPF